MAAARPAATRPSPDRVTPAGYDPGVPTLERLGVDDLRDTVSTFRDVMRAHQQAINRLNVYPVPDGDTGTNMARTLEAVVSRGGGCRRRPGEHLCRHQPRLADGRAWQLRGDPQPDPAGDVIGAAGTRRRDGRDDRGGVARRRDQGLRGRAAPDRGDDPHRRARGSRRRRARAAEGGSLAEVLETARAAGADALERTPDLLPVLKEAGVVDAGGAGFLLLLDAALHVVDGRPLPEPRRGRRPAGRPVHRRRASRRRRRRGRRLRAALRGDVLPRPARRSHRRLQGGVGRDRRFHRRRRWRRHLELPRAHQRHRRGDRGRARARRSAAPDPGHRPVRGGRRRARRARGGDERRRGAPAASTPSFTPAPPVCCRSRPRSSRCAAATA